MNTTAQRVCAWSGVACIAVFFVGFWVLAGFIPPPSPEDSEEEIAEFFREDTNLIRLGLILSMVASTLIGPWIAVISTQLRRIEGKHSVLSYLQLALGGILVLEFIYLIMFWQVAAFRADRDPGDIQTLNDMAWIPFVGLVSTGTMEALVVGAVILMDKTNRPVYPRWSGYFNIWAALMFTPGSVCVFVKDGPFAWDGIFAWYIPLTVFATWMLVMSWLTLRAISEQAENGPEESIPTDGHGEVDVRQLAVELVEVQRRLDRMTAGSAN